jgi:hypothetical protein
MRTLGTEWGRDCVTQKLWTEIARNKAREFIVNKNVNVVFDDMRFANEYDMANEENALTVRVSRFQAPPLEGNHPSDGALEDVVFDERIINDSDDLKDVDVIANRLGARAAGFLGARDSEDWSGPKQYRTGADGLVEALFVRRGQQEWRKLSIGWAGVVA